MTVNIVYIGPKKLKRDNVAGTDVVWNGFGDVQSVPKDKAGKLLAYPTVWQDEEKFKSSKAKPESKPPVAPRAPLTPPGESTGAIAGGLAAVASDNGAKGADRTTAIKNAILSLDSQNPEHFSEKTGVPLTEAVKVVADDKTITFKEVVAAWDEIKSAAK